VSGEEGVVSARSKNQRQRHSISASIHKNQGVCDFAWQRRISLAHTFLSIYKSSRLVFDLRLQRMIRVEQNPGYKPDATRERVVTL
jgi:hypothetical protein